MLERDAALALLKAQEPDDYLLQHSLAAEAIMRALAPRFGGDAEAWGLCGLLHDLDFPHTKNSPERHGLMARELLGGPGEKGALDALGEEYLYAIAAHNGEHTGCAPKSELDFALRAAETLTGLIIAAALMRPTGMQGMEVKSLKKKMKDKAFARAVNRENIKECEKIGLSLDDFLALGIEATSKL